MVDLSPSFSKVREQFKFSELNKHQTVAIISAVKKKDVFVSLPTAFGKSVIFQALPMVLRKSPNCGMGSNFHIVATPTFCCCPAHFRRRIQLVLKVTN